MHFETLSGITGGVPVEFNHISVLLNECINGLRINPNGIYVDGTLGGGGHSLKICSGLSGNGRLIGVDRDGNAIEKAAEVLSSYKDNIILVRDNFVNIPNILEKLGIGGVDGVLLDLGVSSHQLDEASRGFSYMNDAPLDMRMDDNSDVSAYDIVNQYSQQGLTKIILEYGEERWAKRIAGFIVNRRLEKPIETTFELVSVIKAAVPKAARSDGPHPAKRTFQAIRIEVNNELSILERSIRGITNVLKPGGRLCVITFHSLEDRIIKNTFRDMSDPCTCPRDFPVCVCGLKPVVNIVTRKPLLPAEEELAVNNRARSAKLRIVEKRE